MLHSEGKWTQVWNENNSPSTCIIKAIGKDGSKHSVCSINTNEQDMHNAQLIETAPAMLELLLKIDSAINEFGINMPNTLSSDIQTVLKQAMGR